MFEFKFMRSEVIVKPRNQDDDVALRVSIESIFPTGESAEIRVQHRQRILDELVRRDLIFECNHGRLSQVIHPTVNFAGASHGDVQVEEIDLSF